MFPMVKFNLRSKYVAYYFWFGFPKFLGDTYTYFSVPLDFGIRITLENVSLLGISDPVNILLIRKFIPYIMFGILLVWEILFWMV